MAIKFINMLMLGAFIALGVGCYEEPKPAHEVVPAIRRVYLKEKGLTHLTEDVIYDQGLIFDNAYSNLSAHVERKDFNAAYLDYLNLDYNKLTNVDCITEFISLKWLRLNSNALAQLPDLSGLKDLKRLYLKDNKFTEVPQTINSLPSLETLILSNNPISEVPQWLANKKGLEHLSFSNTNIKSLPKDLSAWSTLKTLQLGGLNLTKEEMSRIRAALPNTAVVF